MPLNKEMNQNASCKIMISLCSRNMLQNKQDSSFVLILHAKGGPKQTQEESHADKKLTHLQKTQYGLLQQSSRCV